MLTITFINKKTGEMNEFLLTSKRFPFTRHTAKNTATYLGNTYREYAAALMP